MSLNFANSANFDLSKTQAYKWYKAFKNGQWIIKDIPMDDIRRKHQKHVKV